jgi:hypothetical protein
MNAIKFLTLALLGLLLSVSAWAQKYGDAEIQKGNITVLRQGSRLTFESSPVRVPINHEDVIRVGRDSTLVLATVEKATLTLGSNAVFHVKPWEKRERKGLFRMLFGRFRAQVAALTGGERFNVNTATATIGVKGTDFITATTSVGEAWTYVRDGLVAMAGEDSVYQDIPVDFISVVVQSQPATTPAQAPLAVIEAALDSVPANDPSAGIIPFLNELVEGGVLTEAQKKEILEEEPQTFAELLEEITESVQDSATEAGAPSAPISVQFEN